MDIIIQGNFIVCTLLVDVIKHGDAAEEQGSVSDLERTWLNVGHILKAAEILFEFVGSLEDKIADAIPDNPCVGASFAIVCVPNPAFYVAKIINIVMYGISFALLTAANIAFQVVDDQFTMDTVGEYQFLLVCCHFNDCSISTHMIRSGSRNLWLLLLASQLFEYYWV